MAKEEKTSSAAATPAPAAAEPATTKASQAAAIAEIKKKRFTIKATEKSGPVRTFHGVVLIGDDDTVGYCDVPGTAWHCVIDGYDVTDALTGKPYDGSKPKDAPANA